MKQVMIDKIYYAMLEHLAKRMKKTPSNALQDILINEYNKIK